MHGEKAMAGYDIKVNDNVITYFKSGERYNIVPSYAEMRIFSPLFSFKLYLGGYYG